MARFTYGAGISGISQSISGATFAQAGPTGILRNNPARASIRNLYAIRNRGFFLILVAAWQTTLTNDQRAAWLALGATRKTIDVFGNPVPLNGMGSFIRFNLPLLQSGRPYNAVPPVDFTTTALSFFTIAALAGPQSLTLTALSPNILSKETLVTACTTTLTAGYTSFKRRPRVLDRTAGPVTLPLNLSAKWIEYGGILQAGTTLIASVRVLNHDSGLYGPRLLNLVAVT